MPPLPPPTGIVVRAADRVFWPDGEKWAGNHTPMAELDDIFGEKLEALRAGKLRAVVEPRSERKASEVAAATLGSFSTIVLARASSGSSFDVKAGAGHLNWASSMMSMLLTNVTRCNQVHLIAVKGGPSCDCEINFIEELMKELRAEPRATRKSEDDGHRLVWCWKLPRAGAPNPCTIWLNQYQRVEMATARMIRTNLVADPKSTHTPMLKRLAVKPVRGHGGG
eukprot:2140992-Prymnesium_polylepis.1